MPKNTPERVIDNVYSRHGAGSVTVRSGNTTTITAPAHSHSDYLLLSTYTAHAAAYAAHIANADAHQARSHDIIGASDHTVTGSQYQIVGLTAANTVGLLTPASDISAGNVIAISDGSGNLTVENLTADTSVDTLLVSSPGNLTLTPTPGIGGFLLTEALQKSGSWASGTTGAAVNWNTGVADFRTMTADELVVDAFIAAVKKAHLGALTVTKSMSLTSQTFVVPTPPATATLYVQDIPGFAGMKTFDDGDDIAIPYFNSSVPYAASFPGISAYASDNGTGGATTHYAEEDFEGYSAGDDPTDWYDTGTGNGMTLSDLCDVQSVGGTKAFGSTNSGSNYHTHYDGTGAQALTDYRVTGRFRIGSTSTGIGFTLFSQYESGGSDDYYRVRRYSSKPSFYVANHGDYDEAMTGTTDASYNPAAATWHRFMIEAEDDGTDTIIRAKFWPDGDSEPGSWQIDCSHDHANRGTTGTFGVWLHDAGDGAYVDEIKVESLTGSSSIASSSIDVLTDDVIIASVQCLTAATFTAPAGWTSITSTTYTGDLGASTVRWYRFTAVSDGAVAADWEASTGAILVDMIAVRNLDTADIVEASGTGTFTAASSFQVSGLSPAADNAAFLIMSMHDGYDRNNEPPGMQKYGSEPSITDLCSVIFGQVVTSGATGTRTVGLSTDNVEGAYLQIALNSKTGTTSGISIGTAWGTVVATGGAGADEQAYTFTLNSDSSGEGVTVYPDTVVLDYGVTGDGYVDITTIDPAGSPYMQIATRGANPKTDRTVQLRAGNLKGISGVAAEATWGLYVAGANDARMELSDYQMAMSDINSSWSRDGATFISIDSNIGVELLEADAPENRGLGYTWKSSGDEAKIGLYGVNTGTQRYLSAVVDEETALDSRIDLSATAVSGKDAFIQAAAYETGGTPATFGVLSGDSYQGGSEIRIASANILLDGVTIASEQSPTFSDYTDMILGAETDVGGWGVFSKSSASTRTYFTATSSVTRAIGQAVLTSGSASASITFDLTVGTNSATGTFNSITCVVGVDVNGRLYTQRSTGSNLYDIQLHATWLT